MCIGEACLDSIGLREQQYLRTAATETLPDHRFGVLANDDGVAWVVLEPTTTRMALPRFTICRIAPCVVVMVEGRGGDRRFISVDGLDNAILAMRGCLDHDEPGKANIHEAHAVMQ